ncbi:unnamed protein product [Brassica oleracea var. botrytis]
MERDGGPIDKHAQGKQMVHAIKRKPICLGYSSSYCLCSCRYKKIKALDPEAKFKNAKRRFQEAYQQHEKAKRRRTIQVLEMIPNQRKAQRPLLKRPVRR